MTDGLERGARGDAERILRAGIAAADPTAATTRALSTHDLGAPRLVRVIAVGKAAGAMARAALRHLAGVRAPRTFGALVIEPGSPRTAAPLVHDDTTNVRRMVAAHPLPDLSSVAAADAVSDVLATLEEDDVALILLSGGASSLIARPVDGVSIADYAQCVDLLMRAGADIHDLNTVRRATDLLKGGGMARMAAGARVIGFVLSDVPGNPLHVIGSGPLSPSPTTTRDAVRVLRDTGVWHQCSPALRDALTQQLGDAAVERLDHVSLHVVADNDTAVAGAARAAEELGYDVFIEDQRLDGEARVAGAAFARRALNAVQHGRGRFCRIAGGETVVTVRGDGSGGRNQEFVLAAALALPADARIAVGSAGTDGVDGPTDAAGAVCDGACVTGDERRAAETALERNDAGSYLEQRGLRLVTGPTGTNVADVAVAVCP